MERKKIKAIVVDYHLLTLLESDSKETKETKLPYPIVKIIGKNEELIKLKYANSLSLSFQIGEEIEVFWFAGELLYWDAYDKGMLKYLPSRWLFWKDWEA